MSPRRLPALLLVPVALATLLSGCSTILPAEAADDANNPLCAAVTVRLPEEVQGLAQRETDAQGTSAYGDPAQVLLTCGVDVPAVSPLPCVYVEGTYWLRDDAQAPTYIFTTFGREPAVDVAIRNSDGIAPGIVLSDISTAIDLTEKNGLECTDIEDSLGEDDEATPMPTPSPTTTPAG